MIYYIQKLKWVNMTFLPSKSSSNGMHHRPIQPSSRTKISCNFKVISLLSCNLLIAINRAKLSYLYHQHDTPFYGMFSRMIPRALCQLKSGIVKHAVSS